MNMLKLYNNDDYFLSSQPLDKSGTGEPATKTLMDLPGPKGWPILGSFPDYFKKENQGQMHEMMVSRVCSMLVLAVDCRGCNHAKS